ncbi:hypothetical protein KKC17_00880 [Patescibacteria group bacterium]|nr:hypothetical protein [Patescibacteria group bacterium]
MEIALIALLEEFFQLVKSRITSTSTQIFIEQFSLFCKKYSIIETDREKFLKSSINSYNIKYEDETSHEKFDKLNNLPEFRELIDNIKIATKEKKEIDILRNQLFESIDKEEFEKTIFKEIEKNILETNKDIFTNNKISNLIIECNRWSIKPNKIMSTVKESCKDPQIYFDKKISVFSIAEFIN